MEKSFREIVEEENKVKNCCPICGHEFEEIKPINVCPTFHYFEQEFKPEELIGRWDDYAWCI